MSKEWQHKVMVRILYMQSNVFGKAYFYFGVEEKTLLVVPVNMYLLGAFYMLLCNIIILSERFLALRDTLGTYSTELGFPLSRDQNS